MKPWMLWLAAGLLVVWLMWPPQVPDFDDLPSSEPEEQIASISMGASDRLSRIAWLESVKRYIGVPYKWGGPTCSDGCNNDPANGLDCSGLMYQGAKDRGVKIPRGATKQWESSDPISEEKAKETPGALVFLRRQKTTSKGVAGSVIHMAMSTGDGRTVEAWFNNKVVNPSWGWWASKNVDYPPYYGILRGTVE